MRQPLAPQPHGRPSRPIQLRRPVMRPAYAATAFPSPRRSPRHSRGPPRGARPSSGVRSCQDARVRRRPPILSPHWSPRKRWRMTATGPQQPILRTRWPCLLKRKFPHSRLRAGPICRPASIAGTPARCARRLRARWRRFPNPYLRERDPCTEHHSHRRLPQIYGVPKRVSTFPFWVSN